MRSGVLVLIILVCIGCDPTQKLIAYLEDFELEAARIPDQKPSFDSLVDIQPLELAPHPILPSYNYTRAAERRAILEENNYTSLELIRLPKISFQKRFHDFGVVKEGMKSRHTFGFTNTGNADLLIQFVTASSSTRVEWTKGAIKPGDSGEVLVVYDTSGKEGEEEVVVNIISNTDPEIAEARFRAFIQKH